MNARSLSAVSTVLAAATIVAVAATAAAPAHAAGEAKKIPITTSSAEARQIFVEGRALGDKLRFEESRQRFVQAVAKDPDFAQAHLALANAATSAQMFFDELKKAVALAGKASDGERLLILAQDAGVRGDPATQQKLLGELVAAYPQDERAHMAMGAFHFGSQEWADAITHYQHALAIAPDFSQAYNQMGYAHRFLGDNAAAERDFKKYIELIPDDPNPYDSYAELLMRTGRFTESIAQYEKALAIDPHFVASYIGIANDQIFLGQGDAARATLARLTAAARNSGERRQALFWTAATYVHDGATAQALASCKKLAAIADETDDLANRSGDLNLMGQILLEAGKVDQAQENFAASVAAMEKAQVPADVKEANRRNQLYFDALVALAKGDVAAARAKADAFRTQAEAKKIAFELWRIHELAGRIALAEKRYDDAAGELASANQQDPRVLYLMAEALEKAGKQKEARGYFERVADFNQLNFNLAYVRDDAREKLGKKG